MAIGALGIPPEGFMIIRVSNIPNSPTDICRFKQSRSPDCMTPIENRAIDVNRISIFPSLDDRVHEDRLSINHVVRSGGSPVGQASTVAGPAEVDGRQAGILAGQGHHEAQATRVFGFHRTDTCNRRGRTVSSWKKSVASSPCVWSRRNARQLVSVRRGAGPMRLRARIRRVVPDADLIAEATEFTLDPFVAPTRILSGHAVPPGPERRR